MKKPKVLHGTEVFKIDGRSAGFTVLDFWRWTDSDLLSNALRGRIAEFLVSRALALPLQPRREWVAYDLKTPSGIKLEVKSAAYVQGWMQRRPSTITFDIAPKLGWNPNTAKFGASRRRHAHVYIFALLGSEDAKEANPLNVDSWSFFVLPSSVLNNRLPDQKTIRLSTLRALNPVDASYTALPNAIASVLSTRALHPTRRTT